MIYAEVKEAIAHLYWDDINDVYEEIILAKTGESVEVLLDFSDGYMCKSEYSPILFFVKKSNIAQMTKLTIDIQ